MSREDYVEGMVQCEIDELRVVEARFYRAMKSDRLYAALAYPEKLYINAEYTSTSSSSRSSSDLPCLPKVQLVSSNSPKTVTDTAGDVGLIGSDSRRE